MDSRGDRWMVRDTIEINSVKLVTTADMRTHKMRLNSGAMVREMSLVGEGDEDGEGELAHVISK